MAREFEEYRDVLSDLIESFGDKAWITAAELARYDQCCVRTVKKRYGIPNGVDGINRNVLTRRNCRLAHL